MAILTPPPELNLPENSVNSVPQPLQNFSIMPAVVDSNRYGNKKLQFPSDLTADSNRYGSNRLCINIFNNNQSSAGEAMTAAVTTVAGNIASTDIQKILPGATSRRAAGTFTSKPEFTIFLPIPLALDTNYSINYSDVSVTDLGTSILGSAAKGASDILGLLSKAKGMIGLLSGVAKGGVEGLTGENSKTLLKLGGIQAGLALNPHQELLLNGVKFREFKFAYELIAKNEDDSKAIREIIRTLKISMHPEIAGESLLFKYPSEFELLFYTTTIFGTTQNPYLFKTKRCILKDLQVSYGKNFVTFKDTNAPVDISISMTFQETEILDRASIDKEQMVTF
jgi:hypothetical protein